VANALAAMLLTQMIQTLSTSIFGAKVGAIVGAIASVVAIQVGTSLMNGQSLSAGFGELMKAENIMKLTSSVGEGYQKYVQADIQDMMKQTQEMIADYTAQSKELAAQYQELFGGRGAVDPKAFTDVALSDPGEPSESFLARTLMTGTEIAGMSTDLLSNFASVTLSTDLRV
jgi:hypothetical protein